MKDHINFDVTDAGTIADSDKLLSGIISTDGSTLITDTLEGGKQGLDVYVINSSLTTTVASDHAEDAAHVSGDTGSFALAVRNDSEGSLVDTDGDYAPLQVDASGRLRVVADIDVTNLSEKDEDSAHSSGDTGDFVLAVRQDTLASSTSADGDYAAFKVNSVGELYTTDEGAEALLTTIDADTSAIALDTAALVVDLAAIEVELLDQGTTLDSILTDTNAMVVDLAAIEVELLDQGTTLDTIAGDTTSIDATLTGLSHAEDAAHVSGDAGVMSLAVRNDTLGSLVSTDGDYAPLQVNASGELYVTIGTEIDVDDTANTAVANTATVVGTSATDLVGTDLADRKYAFIYNNGNKQIFVGGSGVTTASGFPLSPGSALELRAGAAIDLHAIKAAGGSANDTRILELS